MNEEVDDDFELDLPTKNENDELNIFMNSQKEEELQTITRNLKSAAAVGVP